MALEALLALLPLSSCSAARFRTGWDQDQSVLQGLGTPPLKVAADWL